MAFIDRTARMLLLSELAAGMALTLRYFFKPKVTLNYPYEKGPLSPRFRYDQLMRLGWKVFLPGSLAYLVLVAGVLVATGWLPHAA